MENITTILLTAILLVSIFNTIILLRMSSFLLSQGEFLKKTYTEEIKPVIQPDSENTENFWWMNV